jgi:hypothetical protein
MMVNARIAEPILVRMFGGNAAEQFGVKLAPSSAD